MATKKAAKKAHTHNHSAVHHAGDVTEQQRTRAEKPAAKKTAALARHKVTPRASATKKLTTDQRIERIENTLQRHGIRVDQGE